MKNLLDIIQKISSTQDAIRKTQDLLRQFPKDYTIMANLESLIRRASALEDSFLHRAHQEHMDVCTYRMIADDNGNYPILSLGSALSDLQRWFSTVYDSLKNGPKQRARLAPEVLKFTTLNFAFTFTGSVGVAMTIPSERMLFDNDLQRAMHKTVEMLKAESSDQIHYFAQELGAASVRSLYNWVSDHIKTGVGAEIRWLRDLEILTDITIDHLHLSNLGKAIEETSDTKEEILELTGDLVGADIQRHTFHMAFEEANEIRGTMSENIGIEYTVELPKRYIANISKSSYVNYATEEEYIRYHLLNLKKA
ncbi:MAG TPA: hypothetical protein VN604_06995 [Nitrospirota bacterium]|nr:hypothetical protein [Nitrospirota bacterium]